MPVLYTDANPKELVYVLEVAGYSSKSGHIYLPALTYIMQAEYLGIIYGISEYINICNKELEQRMYDFDQEASKATGESVYAKVSTPSGETPRPLPPPVAVRCDNEVVVRQLSKAGHIKSPDLRKLAMQVWKMTENLQVKFEWIPSEQDLAGKLLK